MRAHVAQTENQSHVPGRRGLNARCGGRCRHGAYIGSRGVLSSDKTPGHTSTTAIAADLAVGVIRTQCRMQLRQ
eukprot:7369004-Pyramimonas_sp.AAC.1